MWLGLPKESCTFTPDQNIKTSHYTKPCINSILTIHLTPQAPPILHHPKPKLEPQIESMIQLRSTSSAKKLNFNLYKKGFTLPPTPAIKAYVNYFQDCSVQPSRRRNNGEGWCPSVQQTHFGCRANNSFLVMSWDNINMSTLARAGRQCSALENSCCQ